jgi:hypothetical protein
MVSAFEVYLVLQLNTILTVLYILAGVLSSGAAVLFVVWLVNHNNCTTEAAYDAYGRKLGGYSEEYKAKYDAYWNSIKAVLKKLSIAAVVTTLLSITVPSSQTAAAMIIVPALTSKDVVQPLTDEAKDLYALAKGALKKVIEADPEPKTEEVK